MYSKPRVIPVLLLENGDLVKTVKFKKRIYVGDPINAVRIFNEEEADELCLLDISEQNKEINYDLLEDIASEAFMPLSYGGRVRTIESVKKLFRIGFEKIIFNTALIEKPDLIKEAVDYAGSQSIVASVDIKRNITGKTRCYTNCGKKSIQMEIVSYLHHIESLGVGEILINSINNDGMMTGYDLETISDVCHNTKLPVICCGGAGSLKDMARAVKDSGAHAAAAGSMFVFYGPRKAVLINYPGDREQKEAGLY